MAKTYEPIATSTASGSSGTVTFSGIPATYTDLVLVYNGTPSASAQSTIRFNSDTSTNYSDTYLYGDGSGAYSGRNSTQTLGYCGYLGASGANAVLLIHIFNYANSTTYKTYIARASQAGAELSTRAGLWRKTPEAITSITFATNTGNFNSGSTFTLYGIKAA